MLNYYSDRHPVATSVLIFSFLTFIPALFIIATEALFGEGFPSGTVIFLFWLVLQTLLSAFVERPIHTFMPFMVSIIGILLCEFIYVGMSLAFQVGHSPTLGRILLNLGIAVFGPEAAAAVGGMIVYALYSFIKSFIK